MSRRNTRTRLAALALAPALLLAACGDDTGGDGEAAGQGLSAVAVTGDFGTEPEVSWDGPIDTDELESDVLITGDGTAVEDGQQILVRLWVGNGYSEAKAYSSFGKDTPPELLTAGELSPALNEAIDGQTIGSRVAVASPPADAFGEAGNSQLGIGNRDSVLFVADLVAVLPSGPTGADKSPAPWAPKIVGGDTPTGLDFEGTPEPDGKLRITSLITGEGPKTEKGQTVYVNYLGQVYGGKAPFDASYEREAFSFPIGGGQVVPGWDKLLEGVKVGSRVLIAVPPADGYGKEGNKDAGIKGTDTLYFVIDVLAVA